MVRKRISGDRILTAVELELMTIIWRLESCVVRDVLEALPKDRDITYTSVAKIMKILEDKGFLVSEKQEKTHLYRPAVAKEAYEKRALEHVAEKLFDGSPSTMVMKLLDDASLTQAELQAIRKNLEARLKS